MLFVSIFMARKGPCRISHFPLKSLSLKFQFMKLEVRIHCILFTGKKGKM